MSKNRITYSELKKRLERLSRSLLPVDRPFGDYSEAEQDLIHSYVVLVHAELEHYLERLAVYAADQAKRKSAPDQCEPVMSRLIFYKAVQGGRKIEPVTLDAIAGAYGHFETTVIEKNNGIKTGNVFQLFMPLGVTRRDIDPVLLSNLDAFGKDRGEVAHTSARLKQGTSPSSEKKRVDNILRDLAHFDQRVRALV